MSKTYLFRITHIENIPHILEYGITHSKSINANPEYIPIGDSGLISTRSNFKLTNGRLLGEYIPFYFGARTPMLYVIQNGFNLVAPTPAGNIIYCISSAEKIGELGLDFVFTDGHALDSFSNQYDQSEIGKISELIDKNAVKAKYWRDETDLDLKRRKEAEFLVLGDIPLPGVLGFIVFDQPTYDRMLGFGIEKAKLQIKPEFYF